MPEPIDYARADADVVRKKFRRRVVMFVIATVVVMVIGGGWVHSSLGRPWWAGNYQHPISGGSNGGWVWLSGPARKPLFVYTDGWGDDQLNVMHDLSANERRIGNYEAGIWVLQCSLAGYPKWEVQVRYRTLFILAMIPWLITLIRMIRIWKRNRAVGDLQNHQSSSRG